ncbi:MAG: hypothetical protein HYZ28_09810 [Myxococcales bacterium]|nr:hypothetical protein [Myxococcales bacterium]
MARGAAACPSRLLLPALLGAVAAGCPSGQSTAGLELMGTFALTAEPLVFDCPLSEVSEAGFQLTVTFSRDAGESRVAYQHGGLVSEATFDGQVVEAARLAVRRLPSCNCGEQTQLRETLRVALLSQSQDRELSGRCPERPLDGGVPSPDGGVFRPASAAGGFDAVRACGELLDEVVPEHSSPSPDAGCEEACFSCRLLYRVEGMRR